MHKLLMRFNEIYSPVCSSFSHYRVRAYSNYSTSFTHSFQTQAKLPMFQHKAINEVDESQHTIGDLSEPRDVHWQFSQIVKASSIRWKELVQRLLVCLIGALHFRITPQLMLSAS